MKSNCVAVLPTSLVEDLERVFSSKAQRNNATKFIVNLLNKSWRDNKDVCSYTAIPNTYLRKVFSGHYTEWLNPLLAEKIIISNNFYIYKSNNTFTNTICKYYSINTNYYYSPHNVSRFSEKTSKTISYTVKNRELQKSNFDVKKLAIDDFRVLEIDYHQLLRLMRIEVDKIHISMFKLNECLEGRNIEVFFRQAHHEKSYWMSNEKAIEIATKKRKSLIEDDGRFYVMDEFEFILMKKAAMYSAYINSIETMEKGLFFARRNETNNRLDSNFTNMASVFTKEIFKRNNLVQFDLANAQFAILSDIFSTQLDTDDFHLFREQSVNGTLYEYIMDKLNIEKRGRAKTLVFELLFSKETNNSPQKEELRKLFPSVVEKVDDYKKEHGYNKFSIMLQKREAEIFIDIIWNKIKQKNIFCITKHDCLVVREEDKNKVKKIIEECFKKINFFGKIVEE